MALVNADYVDGNGDINDYLEEIGTLTNNQLGLLSTLKEVSDLMKENVMVEFLGFSNSLFYA